MSYNTKDYKNIYNGIYLNIKDYNFHNLVKDIYVDTFAAYISGRILDAGCGEGIHLKRLLKDGYDAFGIELSSVCCEKFLTGVPHDNADIISFAKKGKQFDGLICMDVLEHIPYEGIEETIESLSKLSKKAFIGIANHSDVLNGVELHLIQQNKDWWIAKLRKFYKHVNYISEQFDGRFYYFYCNNTDNEDAFYNKINVILKKCINIDNKRIELAIEKQEHEFKINEMKKVLNEKDSNINKMHNELEIIKNSKGYKLLVKYRKWREKVKGIFK